jgi:hypothetical protein
MKLLVDECVPRKVKFLFADGGHECETVRDAGFSGKENGEWWPWLKGTLMSSSQ